MYLSIHRQNGWMNTGGNHFVRSRPSLILGPPAREGLTEWPLHNIWLILSPVFVDADIAMGVEEIAINLNTQLGRKLKKMECGLCDFMILIRSVDRLDRSPWNGAVV